MRVNKTRWTRTCKQCQERFSGAKYSSICWECKLKERTEYYQDKSKEQMRKIYNLRNKVYSLKKRLSKYEKV